MSNVDTNIPRGIKEYDTYIKQTNVYLIQGTPENYLRFGWTAANLSAWQGFETQWNLLFPLYSDKKGGYTTDTGIGLKNIIGATVLYDKQNKLIFKIKATTGLTPLDCSTFHLPLSLSEIVPSIHHPLTPFTKDKTVLTSILVYPKLIPEGGGNITV